ncbi:lipid phosphate phosphatase epsilon 2, chloroplastic-like isoform X1 [Iris pallida]|uniref:Lipid phosphate phosphatase epsilon 2, chloroplastic-like isoform X1 n=1 Tax=Iris pallida TaxID=29817 RepID=A0AAX6DZ72_IRIPA|nr:lipid phosphate phosphatase epsilon 2, chloroplastic-like isoform X1 [Iris pallida]
MLTSPLLSSSFLPAPKALDSRTIPRPTSKVSILKLNLHSRRELGGGIRRTGVSHQKKDMAGLARMDAIAGAADGPREEDEDGAALSNSGYLAVKGFGTTLNRMSKWLVVAFFALFILWKHDAEALWVAMGSIVNSCISVTLKRTLNQQRPVNASKSDPGMPSSHAQAIFYTATYLVISLFDWPGVNIFTMTIGAITFISSSYLSWLRVVTTVPYHQPGFRWCCLRISMCCHMVLHVASVRASSIHGLFMGSDRCRSRINIILYSLRNLCNPAVGWG